MIFREGSEADRFYIVLSGAVEVWKQKDLLAVHTAGHLFGEMALIDELPRSATVIAREPTRLAYIGRADFQQIIRENSSVAISIIRSVSDMVRSSNEHFLESLRARNLELEQANRALREAQEELLRKERLSTLGKFSSLILHDIRNPISVLRSLAELILLGPEERERVERNARKIIVESDRLNQLASELLDYSRGDIRLNPTIVRLEEFFGRLREAIEERYQARGIAIRMDDRVPGSGDPGREPPVPRLSQPRGQRLEGHAAGRRAAHPGVEGRRYPAGGGQRHRDRHEPGGPGKDLRAFLLLLGDGRHGTGHGHREEHHRGPPRHGLLHQRAEEGHHLPPLPAPGRLSAASRSEPVALDAGRQKW